MDPLRESIGLGLEDPVLHVTRVVGPAQVVGVVVEGIPIDVINIQIALTEQLNHDDPVNLVGLTGPPGVPVAIGP